ncbi:MAG: peptide ABC transporter substrate-binding protein [bacterium]
MKLLIARLVLPLLFGSSAHAANIGGIDSQSGTVTLALNQEPRTLNSLTAESVSYTAQLMVHLQEGLMRYDGRRRLVGGVAEHWQVSADQMQFWLRPDAKWQNGDTVTARDFVFAWQQLVRPDTGSASANLASPIRNAAAIIRGELDPADLGVKAVSKSELLVLLEHPCGWCLKLMTSSIFYPVNREFYEALQDRDLYGTSSQSHLSNGAFIITDWQWGKRIHLGKNQNYWGQARVHLENIRFDYIGIDAKTTLNLFRAGEIVAAGLDRETIPDALGLGYRLKTYPTGQLFNIQFSHRDGMLSDNENLRKAISYVINKDEIVNRVVAIPGTRVSDSMFHDWLTVGKVKFVTAHPPTPHRVDIPKAREYLKQTRAELGLNSAIRITLTINDTNLYRRIAEYLQLQLKTQLDIDLAIDPQTTQMMVDKWRRGTSDMTLITWPVDVDDPMDQISFMGNPDFRRVFQGLYSGDDMAELYYKNRNAVSQQDRMLAIQQVQQLFEERVTVLPLFEAYGAMILNPKFKGFVWHPVRGYADFRYARFVR